MENAFLNDTSALQAMTQVQEALLEAESFLNENYQFRHNLLSGKTELKRLPDASAWEVLTEMAVNSIILHAKREGIGGKRSPRNNIEELLHSNQVLIFGKAQEDRPRFASFLATTNEAQPLCDETGSRRYLCIKIPKGQLIDNESPIDYAQLFAQLKHELQVDKVPYWFSNAEVARIQRANLPYQRSESSLERLVCHCYQLPEGEAEGTWLSSNEVLSGVKRQFPQLRCDHSTKVRLGKVLRFLGCESKHTREGMVYRLNAIAA